MKQQGGGWRLRWAWTWNSGRPGLGTSFQTETGAALLSFVETLNNKLGERRPIRLKLGSDLGLIEF